MTSSVWHTVTLGEIVDVKGGKRLPKGKTVLDTPTPYRYIRVQDFNGFSVDVNKVKYIDREAYEAVNRYAVFQDEVIISIVGSIGFVGKVPKVLSGSILTENAAKLVVLDKRVVCSDYLMYYLQSEYGQNEIRARIVGSTQPKLPLYAIKEIKIQLPPIEIQHKIADILGSLDDKIELNRRMNETLEQMAMAVYKHWFVDFGPFQDGEFEESELGPIPKGWTIKKLSTLVETQYGYTESASTEKVGPHFLRGTDINKTTHIDWTTVPYCKISQEDYEKYKLLPGDIVVIRMADPGKPAIVEQDVDAVFASYLVRLKIKKGSGLLPYYLFYFLLSDRYQNYIGGASNGTTRKSANAKVLTDIDIIIPDVDTIRLFEEKVGQLRRQITLNIQEINTLSELRDYLLPRLLSGEIEVREAEEQVEEVLAHA